MGGFWSYLVNTAIAIMVIQLADIFATKCTPKGTIASSH